jgi:hypothetical protein
MTRCKLGRAHDDGYDHAAKLMWSAVADAGVTSSMSLALAAICGCDTYISGARQIQR